MSPLEGAFGPVDPVRRSLCHTQPVVVLGMAAKGTVSLYSLNEWTETVSACHGVYCERPRQFYSVSSPNKILAKLLLG
jgi:hypothetical protein